MIWPPGSKVATNRALPPGTEMHFATSLCIVSFTDFGLAIGALGQSVKMTAASTEAMVGGAALEELLGASMAGACAG